MPRRKRPVRVNSVFFALVRRSRLFLETQIIAKSSITLDVKPWDDETDLEAMEKAVRSIVADGLIWGPCKSFLRRSPI